MGKLTPSQVDEYFSLHLPYRTRIMLAHYKMTRESWTAQRGPVSWLQACFEALLITGRLYLNLLGVGAKRDGSALRVMAYPERDDLSVEDLGGVLLDPTMLPPDEQSLQNRRVCLVRIVTPRGVVRCAAALLAMMIKCNSNGYTTTSELTCTSLRTGAD